MKVCIGCKTEMKCVKNGVALHFGGGHAYMSDVFQCPHCGNRVAVATQKPIQLDHPENVKFDEIVHMQ